MLWFIVRRNSIRQQACLCIRNIAARGPTLRAGMLDEGCESSLREAGKLRGCVDEAYGALRDLECEVCRNTCNFVRVKIALPLGIGSNDNHCDYYVLHISSGLQNEAFKHVGVVNPCV